MQALQEKLHLFIHFLLALLFAAVCFSENIPAPDGGIKSGFSTHWAVINLSIDGICRGIEF